MSAFIPNGDEFYSALRSNNELKKELIYALENKNKAMVQWLISENLFYKEDDIKIIGFNNYLGEWSGNLINYASKGDKEIFILPLTKTDTENKDFLSVFDAFINPGAGDSFPGSNTFNLNAGAEYNIHVLLNMLISFISEKIDPKSKNNAHTDDEFDIRYLSNGEPHLAHEHAYQNVIKYALEHNIPYLGLCNGAQHLILHQGGYLARTAVSHNHVPHTIDLIKGSITHFMAMNDEEQSLAIARGHFPELKFAINTQHKYAGVLGKIGSLSLGGLSDANVVEAVAHSFFQVGFQFHPENLYKSCERNANLLHNIFKFFAINAKKVDLAAMDAYMQKALDDAFATANCWHDEYETCSAEHGFALDIFAEAMYDALLMVN